MCIFALNFFDMGSTETKKNISSEAVISKAYTLMLYNDDVNTFDHVIHALVRVCGHSPEQAEQCAFLVHYKGKCDVRRGTLKELKPMHAALGNKGLTADILE
jgi:ATP-dependent Clp protease adaptor protein ClpS